MGFKKFWSKLSFLSKTILVLTLIFFVLSFIIGAVILTFISGILSIFGLGWLIPYLVGLGFKLTIVVVIIGFILYFIFRRKR